MRPSPKGAILTQVILAILLPVLLGGCGDSPVQAEPAPDQGQDPNTLLAFDEELDDESFRRRGEPFADAEVFFEFNTTDNDLGFQVLLDAEGWNRVVIAGSGSSKVVQISAKGPLAELGITELRFESAEPSPAEVLALFPPGEYRFSGKTVEGGFLFSEAELSHDFVPAFEFTPSEGVTVDPLNTVITWNAPDAELMEIILESEDAEGTFDVIVPASLSGLNVPPQFLEEGVEYKIELLAYHGNGNRTIVESTFFTPS